MSYKINPRLEKDFKDFLENANKPVTTSYGQTPPCYALARRPHAELVHLNGGHDDFRECGNNPESYMDKCSIFFYEFSSLNLGCRYYCSYKEFISFTKQFNIHLTELQERTLKYGVQFWVTCEPHKNTVIIGRTRTGFEIEYKKAVTQAAQTVVAN